MSAPPSRLRFRKPMGAKDYEEHAKRVVFPCYVQPKLDGVRCVTDGRRFWSRNGKLFPEQNVEHLKVRGLRHLLDGELSVAGEGDFEDIVSIVRRAGHENAGKICFNAFDVMTPEPYVVRKAQLKHVFESTLIKAVSTQWNRLTTKKALLLDHVEYWRDEWLARGYEGVMIRNAMGLYVPKKTADLLKWKPLKDAEFEIVDVLEAKGKDRGTPVFQCWTGHGRIDDVKNWFRVRPMGDLRQRRRMWRGRADLPGQMLTVEYQNLTKYGVPRFPRAKVLRDYE